MDNLQTCMYNLNSSFKRHYWNTKDCHTVPYVQNSDAHYGVGLWYTANYLGMQ